jgi:hypothetical protein
MRSVFPATSLVVAAVFGLAAAAHAQEPKRSPAAAPQAQTATETQAPREFAVPREAAAPRDVAPKAAPRTETTRGEAVRMRSSDSSSSVDDQERRGAVRRPPSDGGRGGQAPRDRAVARTGPPPRDWDRDRDRGRDRDRIYYYPSYWSYGRYYDPYYSGLHFGYLAYSPWGWTPAFFGYPYGPGSGWSGGWGQYGYGALRIKVKPRDAEVYVDGYFAGNVDDFDGVFQSLKLETGGYKVEIRKPGMETLTFDVHVQPDRTITYRGEMRNTP